MENEYGKSQFADVLPDMIELQRATKAFMDTGCPRPKYSWYKKIWLRFFGALIIMFVVAEPVLSQDYSDPYGSLAASSSYTNQLNQQNEMAAQQAQQQEQMREQRDEIERQQQQIQQQQDQFNSLSPAERMTYGHL